MFKKKTIQGIPAQANVLNGVKSKLANCQKVAIIIPIDNLNPKDNEVTVQINGHTYQIQRGVEVYVPLPIKKLLQRGHYLP